MEFSLSNPKTLNNHFFFPKLISPSFSTAKQGPIQWAPPKKMGPKTTRGVMIKCGKNTRLVVELERELKEIENDQGRREMNKKCKEGSTTLVELLECLEREAIMGDDQGREPIDYNRRALIFDKSSKVFQALKEITTTNDVTTTT